MGATRLTVAVETFPIAGGFVISRGAKTEAILVVATLESDGFRGRGECVPYARYGENAQSVLAEIEAVRQTIEAGIDNAALQELMPPGAARNALDCALWDLRAKQRAVPVHRLLGLPAPATVVTAFTISLGSPEAMAQAAKAASFYPLLKLKLGGDGDAERLAAVRQSVPKAELIGDANEAWSPQNLVANLEACARHDVRLIEQPLPAGQDAVLAEIAHSIPICADESCHKAADVADLRGLYDAVNVKLDKTGGLTEALATVAEAERLGFQIMIGSMVGTSLGVAPALLLAGKARYVDLDGPLLLAADRANGLRYDGARIYPPAPALWG
ncbi:MAG TPA: N-acetyl-D-Glu racemase DgcA [Methylovirgula sp.]|nr:N-acetyl-D-Glu racemase DgcA [Methylovirgula sp.]